MESPTVPTHLVDWRSTTMENGGPSVTMAGIQSTLTWLAGSLDLPVPVYSPLLLQVVLEGEIPQTV